MPKQVVVMMSDHYPFGQCEENVSEDARILVRKIYEVNAQEINKLLEKANILRRLKSQQLIKLQSVLQEDQSVHFLFEYVPIRLQTWISNINDQFIENFRDQLVKFSHYLANNSIIIEFRLKNIGMNHDYGAKYFLDPGFVYDPTVNKERLKSQYIRDIHNLFRPYIENDNKEQEEVKQSQATFIPPVTQQVKKQQQTYVQKPVQSRPISKSPPTNEGPQSRRKQPNLRGYPTDINVSVDEQILTDILGVLDDEQEEQDYRPKSYTQTGDNNYFGTAKYQPPTHKFPKGNGMMKQSGGYDSLQEIGGSGFTNGDKKKVHLQSSINNLPKAKENVIIPTQTVNKPKTSQIEPKLKESQSSSEYQEQVIWRESDDLQNRIRKAIENSRSIIRRFKSIKGTKD